MNVLCTFKVLAAAAAIAGAVESTARHTCRCVHTRVALQHKAEVEPLLPSYLMLLLQSPPVSLWPHPPAAKCSSKWLPSCLHTACCCCSCCWHPIRAVFVPALLTRRCCLLLPAPAAHCSRQLPCDLVAAHLLEQRCCLLVLHKVLPHRL